MPRFFEGRVLAIETSCDETSAAIVQGSRVLSNVIASQADLHRRWGGVVPEAAARAHVEAILPVVSEAMEPLGNGGRPDAVAVTCRPGLIGALSVGLCAAKALCVAWRAPLIGIHHLEGHLSSILHSRPDAPIPHVALIVSGGHTETVLVRDWGLYSVLGRTIDDAAGEAFDKGARILGLGYPGGHAVQEAARHGDPNRYRLPRGLAGDTLDFSFSGLKTAVLRLAEKEGKALDVRDAAASLQEAIIGVLAERAVRAAIEQRARAISLVGGVAANLALRERLREACDREGLECLVPDLALCTDNAGMIGVAASWRLARGDRDSMDLDVQANGDLEQEHRNQVTIKNSS